MARFFRLRHVWLTAACLLLASCGATLPHRGSINPPLPHDNSNAIYTGLQARLTEVDGLSSLTAAQKTEAKLILTNIADHSYVIDQYVVTVEAIQDSNTRTSAVYGWLNGVVTGLGALLAGVNGGQNSGKAAGVIGAAWAALGLTVQKAFVDPKVSAGSTILTKASAVRQKILTAGNLWEDLLNAPAAGQSDKYSAWLTAARDADAAAADLLGTTPVSFA
jgi:hypothetical protein